MIEQALQLIQERIIELQYEKVRLKTFIESDQVRKENIEFGIDQLTLIYNQIQLLDPAEASELA